MQFGSEEPDLALIKNEFETNRISIRTAFYTKEAARSMQEIKVFISIFHNALIKFYDLKKVLTTKVMKE